MLPATGVSEHEGHNMAKKVSKTSVNYRHSFGKEKCGNCVMFRSGECTLVAGKINEDCVCDKWAAKGK